MLEHLIAALIASTSPSPELSTCYGFNASDVYPSTGKVIGYRDRLGQERDLWFQKHPRKIRGIAHKCRAVGSFVVAVNPRNGKRAVLRVVDRGPYDVLTKSGKVIKAGKWDIPYPSCVDLGHSGKQRIKVYRVTPGSRLEQALIAKHGRCPPRNPNGRLWWQIARQECLKTGVWKAHKDRCR